MEEVDKAWLAAAIDGEGSIGVYKKAVKITIHNANEDFLKKAFSLFDGAGGISKRLMKSGNYCFILNISRQDVVLNVLERILPYLIVKKSNALLCIDFLKNKFNGNFSSVPTLNQSGHSLAGRTGNHYLKGNRGNSEQHRLSALKSKNNHLKGYRGDPEGHSMASKGRCSKQKQIDLEAHKHKQ